MLFRSQDSANPFKKDEENHNYSPRQRQEYLQNQTDQNRERLQRQPISTNEKPQQVASAQQNRGLSLLRPQQTVRGSEQMEHIDARLNDIDKRIKRLRGKFTDNERQSSSKLWFFYILGLIFLLVFMMFIYWFGFKPTIERQVRQEVARAKQNEQPSASEADYMKTQLKLQQLLRIQDLENRSIAAADAASFDILRQKVKNKEFAFQEEATSIQSALLRIQQFFASGGHMPGGYTLNVEEIFPGKNLKRESDLSVNQVISVLNNEQQIWPNRARAAQLLRGVNTTDSLLALVDSINREQDLNVRREAIASLQKHTAYYGCSLLDAPSMLEWWEKNKKAWILETD